MPANSWIARCDYCRGAVFRMGLKTSSWHKTDFDVSPWAPEDETAPTDLTAAQTRRWWEDRPYRLSLCLLDFEDGTYRVAVHKSRQQPPSGQALFQAHWCAEKDLQLFRVYPR